MCAPSPCGGCLSAGALGWLFDGDAGGASGLRAEAATACVRLRLPARCAIALGWRRRGCCSTAVGWMTCAVGVTYGGQRQPDWRRL